MCWIPSYLHQIINETRWCCSRRRLMLKGQCGDLPYVTCNESWMPNILWLHKQRGRSDPFKSCEYVFKVQTELPHHFKDQLPLSKVALVTVSAFVGRTDQIWVSAWLVFCIYCRWSLQRHLINPIKNLPCFPSSLSCSLTLLHYYFL